MLPIRLATTLTLVGGTSLFAQCPPEPETCPETQPEQDCACEPEEALGCTDDGVEHQEAFVCVDGVWADVSGTPDADLAFCGSVDAHYAACFVDPISGEMEVLCAIPGFIGLSKVRRPMSPLQRPLRRLRQAQA